MRRLSIVCAVFLSSMLMVHPVFARENPWIEVRSPNFRVLTNGSQKDAGRVAREFEQLRYIFAAEFPKFRLDSGAPLTIFAVADENTAKFLEPRVWKSKGAKPAGLFHHGWEKQYVMVRLDTWGQHEIVYHEYTHTILHMNFHWIPAWLDEGLAEYYAYTRFQEHKIFVGAPTERYRTLATAIPIPVETLIDINQGSPYYHDPNKAQMFYAESWALVHFMNFGPGMDRGKRLNQFFSLVQQGMEQKKAFLQVFGDFREIDKALNQYTRKFAFSTAVLQDPPQIQEKEFSSRKLSMAETEAELGGFHLWNHDPPNAKPLIEQALKEDPKLGIAHENMGFLHFADEKDTDAANVFAQAYALDGSLYLSLWVMQPKKRS